VFPASLSILGACKLEIVDIYIQLQTHNLELLLLVLSKNWWFGEDGLWGSTLCVASFIGFFEWIKVSLKERI
jgi:hypothetical protein